MDTVAIETLAEWKLLVNAINKDPPKVVLDKVHFQFHFKMPMGEFPLLLFKPCIVPSLFLALLSPCSRIQL